MSLKDPKRSLIYALAEELTGALKRSLTPFPFNHCFFYNESNFFVILWFTAQFKKRVKSIAVDGSDVLSAAMEAAKRASSRLEAKEAAAKAKAKKEEERVAELKKVRGETIWFLLILVFHPLGYNSNT